ncbi:MAG: conjugal transfer protein TraV [Rickettsia endosymbiont of Pseudomimeciton antennatum]|nr:conjugal transfer protein TraV [Rickettsia endosymbiont of Pseudomimeciton antennatum]
MSNIKQLINSLLLLILTINISGCNLMPYKSDFDCPIPDGQKCKSLYEINKMTDQGLFDPNTNDDDKCCRKNNKAMRSSK